MCTRALLTNTEVTAAISIAYLEEEVVGSEELGSGGVLESLEVTGLLVAGYLSQLAMVY